MKLIVFDLDDTLYKERDFVDSAFRNISSYLSGKYSIDYSFIYNALKFNDGNPFDSLSERLAISGIKIEEDIAWLVDRYRTHFPDMTLDEKTIAILNVIKEHGDRIAIITDGRVISQTNKIKALGLDRYLKPENISISEAIGADKSSVLPFKRIMTLNPDAESFTYVADNIAKDFVWPNRLGWKTVMLLDSEGTNIHPQQFDKYTGIHRPDHTIATLSDLHPLLYNDVSLNLNF